MNEERMDRKMSAWMDVRQKERMKDRMDRWTDGLIDGWIKDKERGKEG